MKPIVQVAKEIRQALKKEFPDCKFSVRKSEASMCAEVTIAVMQAPFTIMVEEADYRQLNKFQLLGKIQSRDLMCNGYQMTQQGWDLMARAARIAMEVNPDFGGGYDYLSVHVGKWDKPFEVKAK